MYQSSTDTTLVYAPEKQHMKHIITFTHKNRTHILRLQMLLPVVCGCVGGCRCVCAHTNVVDNVSQNRLSNVSYATQSLLWTYLTGCKTPDYTDSTKAAFWWCKLNFSMCKKRGMCSYYFFQNLNSGTLTKDAERAFLSVWEQSESSFKGIFTHTTIRFSALNMDKQKRQKKYNAIKNIN